MPPVNTQTSSPPGAGDHSADLAHQRVHDDVEDQRAVVVAATAALEHVAQVAGGAGQDRPRRPEWCSSAVVSVSPSTPPSVSSQVTRPGSTDDESHARKEHHAASHAHLSDLSLTRGVGDP